MTRIEPVPRHKPLSKTDLRRAGLERERRAHRPVTSLDDPADSPDDILFDVSQDDPPLPGPRRPARIRSVR